MLRSTLSLFSFVLLGSGCMSVLPSLAPTVEAEPDIKAAFPFETKYVEVLDSRMAYVEAGEGPPVLMVHGNPTYSYLWRNVIPHVAKTNRVIAVDLIGMGKSGKPDSDYRLADHIRYFDAFVEAMQLKDVVLVLHDWGGGVGFDYAMRHQQNVRGIAFMEAVTMPFTWGNMSPPEEYMFRTMRAPEGDQLLVKENYFIEKLMSMFAGRKLTDEEMDHYRAPYLEPAHRKPVRVWPQEVPLDRDPADVHERVAATYERLKTSDIPLLLLVAEPGAIMNEALVAQLTEELPRMKKVSVGPGMHFIQETQPTAVGVATSDWVNTLRAWQEAGAAGPTSVDTEEPSPVDLPAAAESPALTAPATPATPTD